MIVPGTRIGNGYTLIRPHSPGPIGSRWLAQSQDSIQRLVDIVDVGQSSYLKALCENSSQCRDELPHPKNVINLLEVGWATRVVYYQVLDLAIDARPLSEIHFSGSLSDLELWRMADGIIAGIHHLRIALGAVVPQSLYMQAGSICVGDYWWGHHMTGGGPFCKALATFLPDYWPFYYLPFLAPESLQGKEITLSSDVFSMGVLFFYFLTGQYPREAPSSGEPVADRKALLLAKYRQLDILRPDLDPGTVAIIEKMLIPEEEDRMDFLVLRGVVKHIRKRLGDPFSPEDEWMFR